MIDLDARYDAAQTIARTAGQMALKMLADPASLGIEMKGPQDFVTAADRAVERYVSQALKAAFPDDGFLGEETADLAHFVPDAVLWVVDPIDGTSNFAAGRPDWCVSIGLIVEGVPEIGVIYQATLDRLCAARRGHGAWRDGTRLHVADRPIATATIGLDHSGNASLALHLEQINAILTAGGEYRRNGSAAVSLSQVAQGTLDGFAEMFLWPWDVMAGIVLVTEAGGWCSPFLASAGLAKGAGFIACSPTVRDRMVSLPGWNAG